jgi:hypothetical protein
MMESKWQQLVVFFVVALGAIALLVPLAEAARTQAGPGQVPSRLGSPDPREHAARADGTAGLVPMRLGSQDPRDTARSTGVSFVANH